MLNPYPMTVLLTGTALSILSFCLYLGALALCLTQNTGKKKLPEYFRLALLTGFQVLWVLFFSLAILSLTFDETFTFWARLGMSAVFIYSLIFVWIYHDFSVLIPAVASLISNPYLEMILTVKVYPWALLVFLALDIPYAIVYIAQLRSAAENTLSLQSIPDGLEQLDDGILFADRKGNILLTNQIFRNLSLSIFRHSLENAEVFWQELSEFTSNEMFQKVSYGDTFLIRFTSGNIWSFFREDLNISGKEYIQLIALNTTELDKLKKKMLQQRVEAEQCTGEIARLEQLQQTIEHLRKENTEIRDRIGDARNNIDTLAERVSSIPQPDEAVFQRISGALEKIIQNLPEREYGSEAGTL